MHVCLLSSATAASYWWCSLKDDMLELFVEVWDLSDLGIDSLFVLGTRPNCHAKVVRADVPVAWVDAADAVVFVITHERQIVVSLLHILPVEEKLAIEGSFGKHGSEVRRACVNIETKVVTIAHTSDEMLANELSHICLRLSFQSGFDDFWSYRAKFALVLHESAYTALLVPNKQVLACVSRSDHDDFKLLQVVHRPGLLWYVSFNHCTYCLLSSVFVCRCLFYFNYSH